GARSPERTGPCRAAPRPARRRGGPPGGCHPTPAGRSSRRRTRAARVPPTPLVGGKPVLAPHARDAPPAGGAAAVRADPLPRDHVPRPLDQQIATIGTPGVLPAAHPARGVPGVDEVEARRRPGLTGPDEQLRGGVVRVGHAVVLVERGDVPWALGAHR